MWPQFLGKWGGLIRGGPLYTVKYSVSVVGKYVTMAIRKLLDPLAKTDGYASDFLYIVTIVRAAL